MTAQFARRLSMILAGSAMFALSACAAPGFRADVARFQSQLPAPQGQSFAIVAAAPDLAGGIEFGQYANLVAGELTRVGYRAAAPGEPADLVVAVNYGVDKGSERTRTAPGYYDPWNSYYGWGRGFYRPVIFSGRGGRRYIRGWYDPFLFGGFGSGFDDYETYTVFTSGLDLRIDRRADGMRLFEGRAEAQSRDNDLTRLVPNLVEAMFTGFPGNSGEKVRITVAPPTK